MIVQLSYDHPVRLPAAPGLDRLAAQAVDFTCTGIRDLFGDIDIYLFDQLARGRLDHRRRVLDAGCGAGRNLRYLLAHDYDCHGIDGDSSAIAQLRQEALLLGRSDADERFIVGDVESL